MATFRSILGEYLREGESVTCHLLQCCGLVTKQETTKARTEFRDCVYGVGHNPAVYRSCDW
jgi:hypothetical protein